MLQFGLTAEYLTVAKKIFYKKNDKRDKTAVRKIGILFYSDLMHHDRSNISLFLEDQIKNSSRISRIFVIRVTYFRNHAKMRLSVFLQICFCRNLISNVNCRKNWRQPSSMGRYPQMSKKPHFVMSSK